MCSNACYILTISSVSNEFRGGVGMLSGILSSLYWCLIHRCLCGSLDSASVRALGRSVVFVLGISILWLIVVRCLRQDGWGWGA